LDKALGYETLERNLIGEPKGTRGNNSWTDNRLVFAVLEEATGYVESAIAEVADRVGALSGPVLETFKNCHPWLVIRLIDPEFVELHFDHEVVAKSASVGLAVSVENRS
jgi:hypothetical protein